jgi:hypothetical protein
MGIPDLSINKASARIAVIYGVKLLYISGTRQLQSP